MTFVNKQTELYEKTLLLSIIICTYNRENFLRQVLESLTRQTLDQDEYEVVDLPSARLPLK